MIRGGASCSFGLWDSGDCFGGSVLQIRLGAPFLVALCCKSVWVLCLDAPFS